MDTIINVIKDIVRYKSLNLINTGDRQLDGYITTFTATIIAIVFTYISAEKINVVFKQITNKMLCVLGLRDYREDSVEKFKEVVKKYKTCSIDLTAGPLEGFNYKREKIAYYILRNTKFPDKTCSYKFNFTTHKIKHAHDSFSTSVLELLRKAKETCLVQVCSDSTFIGVSATVSEGNSILIYFESELMFQEFMDIIDNEKIDDNLIKYSKENKDKYGDNTKEQKQLYIYDHMSDSRYVLYKDRVFHRIISKHKTIIQHYLDDMNTAMKEERSPFNGHGSYNVGIILYGPPGTGKTSFIKAICNYLGRNMLTINMTDIKTNKQFNDLFTKNLVTDYVYAIDEIDCVAGFLRRNKNSKNEEEENNPNSQISKLRERYTDLVKAKCAAGKNNAELVEKEVDAIKKEMEDVKNKLNLYSILTILDGSKEMRGRVIIACTNHIDQIDEAVLRPNRFDLKLKLEEFECDEVKEMLLDMFEGKISEKEKERILMTKFPSGKYTPADLVNIAHRYRTIDKIISHLTHIEESKEQKE